MSDVLRDRIAAAAREVRIHLGPNSLAMAQRGTPIVLTPGECDALANALLPLVEAAQAEAWDGAHETFCDRDHYGDGPCVNPYAVGAGTEEAAR